MKNEQIIHAMQHLDHQLIDEAAQPAAGKRRRLRTALLAACLCLAIALPAAAAGNLLVKHSYGSELPDHLAGQELDAYYEILNTHKLPLSTFSQAALEGAAYQGFQTWEEMEAFLGVNILDNPILSDATSQSVELTDADGRVVQNAPCTLVLSRSPEGELHAVYANYFCLVEDNTFLSVTASALTELSPDDSAGSLGIDYGEQQVRSQTSETHLTPSGAQATLITTQLSGADSWDVDGWILQNGFVVRLSLSTTDVPAAKETLRLILDSFS